MFFRSTIAAVSALLALTTSAINFLPMTDDALISGDMIMVAWNGTAPFNVSTIVVDPAKFFPVLETVYMNISSDMALLNVTEAPGSDLTIRVTDSSPSSTADHHFAEVTFPIVANSTVPSASKSDEEPTYTGYEFVYATGYADSQKRGIRTVYSGSRPSIERIDKMVAFGVGLLSIVVGTMLIRP